MIVANVNNDVIVAFIDEEGEIFCLDCTSFVSNMTEEEKESFADTYNLIPISFKEALSRSITCNTCKKSFRLELER